MTAPAPRYPIPARLQRAGWLIQESEDVDPSPDHPRAAAEAARQAAEQTRTVARQLKDRGLSGRDIAAILKVSPQRVSQLLNLSKAG
jgi:DNA-directed RNA polymerase specialized sigma subunit